MPASRASRTSRVSVVLAIASSSALFACGGSDPAPKTATSSETTSSTVATTTSGADGAATTATSDDGSKSGTSGDGKKKVWHWKDFAGPKVKATALPSKTVWGVVPVGLDGKFDVLKIALQTYGKPEGDEQQLLDYDQTQTYVPAALVKPTMAAKGLVKGDAVMANVGAASGFGRVVALVKGDDGATTVKLKYAWGGSLSDAELPLDEVIKLEDKVAFGHPIATKDESGDWALGQEIYSDAKDTWVIGFAGAPKQYATKDVKALKVGRPLAKGAKVSAYGSSFKFEPAKVVEVIEGGVQYKVKFDSGKEDTLALEQVSAPL